MTDKPINNSYLSQKFDFPAGRSTLLCEKGLFFLPLFAIWIPPIYSMLNKIYDLSNNSFVDREFFSLIFEKKIDAGYHAK